MKSIMEEASSILKAIEKGWNRAGKPQEFSVKIFEEPTHNFFGMTTKSAKIGIFFKEEAISRQPQRTHQAAGARRQQPTKRGQRRPAQQQEPSKAAPERKRLPKEYEQSVGWSNEMKSFATNWIKQSLLLLDLPNITFTTTIERNHLKFHFDTPVIGQVVKEKILFRSFAYLLLQALRNEFKEPLRGLKVVLTSD